MQLQASTAPPIIDTGVRGYLKWLQRENPGLYQVAAPSIAQGVPRAFSDFNQSMMQAQRSLTALQGLAAIGRAPGTGMMGFADATSDVIDSSAALFDSSGVGPDTASAANVGTTGSDVTSTLTNIVGAAANAYMAANQVSLLNQVNTIQLQRAQAGLPPLNIDMSKMGVPQVNVGLSASTQSLATVALIGGGLLLLVVMLGKRKRA